MIHFVGAGPGDPDLITVKGQRLLAAADLIIYAGSLVNPALLAMAKPGCAIHDSAALDLDQVISLMGEAAARGHATVRLHTGDPSIYGAIREQMDRLRARGIAFEQVPGVSSFFAAAAALKAEYTLPGITQTVILTRMEGRTAVPGPEAIRSLASHGSTMVVFLSVHQIDGLVGELLAGGSYRADTPVAVVHKASWPDQRIVRGTLADIAAAVETAGIRKTALVVIGDFLGDEYELSKLYDPGFSHGYRQARE